MQSDQLGGIGRIYGLNLVGRFYQASADDEVVFAAELATNLLDGSAHLARVFFLGKVGERLVDERSFMKRSFRLGWSLKCRHDCVLVDMFCEAILGSRT